MAEQPAGCAIKKLDAAARHWATGGRISRREQEKQFEQDAERYGIPLDYLMATLPDELDEFEVWPENESSLTLFLACSTQWETQNNRVVSINYQALHAAMQMLEMTDRPQLFRDIRVMESVALAEFNKRDL
jgi:hypothetical protein